MSRKIDLASVPTRAGSNYPPPLNETGMNKLRHKLGDAAGLTQFGVNRLELAPGAWSSLRHWHSAEDEFVYVLQGEVVLVTDAGEELLRPGDCAGFRAGDTDGHHLQNCSGQPAVVLEIGSRLGGDVDYPDVDMLVRDGRRIHKNGRPYPDPLNPTVFQRDPKDRAIE